MAYFEFVYLVNNVPRVPSRELIGCPDFVVFYVELQRSPPDPAADLSIADEKQHAARLLQLKCQHKAGVIGIGV